jgi:hypothetical protein
MEVTHEIRFTMIHSARAQPLSDDHHTTLKKKVQRLSDQLDAVKKASEAVAREEVRAKESVEHVNDAPRNQGGSTEAVRHVVTARDVERIARDVFTQAGRRLTVIAARPSERGWIVSACDRGGDHYEFALSDGPPSTVRRRLTELVAEP